MRVGPSIYYAQLLPSITWAITAPATFRCNCVLQGTQRDRQRRLSAAFGRTFVDPLAQPPFSGRGRAWRQKQPGCRARADDGLGQQPFSY